MIYVDNPATTKISDSVFEKMLPFLRKQYGNTSSQHSLGVKANRAVELARKQVAIAIGAEPSGITFTSGGSEAYSLVIICVAENIAGIVAVGYAIEESVREMVDMANRLKAMVRDTVNGKKDKIPPVRVNGDSANRFPGL